MDDTLRLSAHGWRSVHHHSGDRRFPEFNRIAFRIVNARKPAGAYLRLERRASMRWSCRGQRAPARPLSVPATQPVVKHCYVFAQERRAIPIDLLLVGSGIFVTRIDGGGDQAGRQTVA